MTHMSSKRWRGLGLTLYWCDGELAINLNCGSLTYPDHGTRHCAYELHGEIEGIPDVEDLIATAIKVLETLQAERGRPLGRPIRQGMRWTRRHASGIPSGDHRGGRARWTK